MIDVNNVVSGRALSDGNIVNRNGRLNGEVVSGDIVIGNNDKVAGYVTLDGRVKGKDGSVVGRLLSGEMAIDNNDGILGRIYKIGAAILGNDGKYIGRLTAAL